MPRPFRYLADPLFITSLILYALNRHVLKPHHIGGWFTHGYFNDVLCLPLFIPIILYIQHLARLRPSPRPPRLWEILIAFAAFTLVYQVILPRFPNTFIAAHDPWDIAAYATGGLIAWFIWSIPRYTCERNRLLQQAIKMNHPSRDGAIPYTNCGYELSASQNRCANALDTCKR